MGFRTRSTIAIVFLFAVLLGIVLGPAALVRVFTKDPAESLITLTVMLIILPIPVIMLLINYGIAPLLIGWIFRVQWVDPDTLATQYQRIAILLQAFAENTKGIKKMPKFGIIHDGNPNAFTYGWSKNTSRVVVTSGLLEICNQDEVLAVINHELGHIKNGDVVLTVVISIVPMVCYTIARMLMQGASRGGGGGKNEGAVQAALVVVALLAYLLYYVTYFVTLFVSRMREYLADKHSAETTKNPNLLASALVKIAYGLVRPPAGASQEIYYNKKAYQKASAQQSTRISYLRTLGIFDRSSAMALAVSGMTASGGFSPEAVSRAAAWDLRNPWAKLYEIGSSHPLPANRLIALNRASIKQGIAPVFPLAEADEYADAKGGKSLGGEFAVDLLISAGPTLVWLASIGLLLWWALAPLFGVSTTLFGLDGWTIFTWGIALAGVAIIGKTMFKYGGGRDFPSRTVMDLLGEIHVSPVRPVRASLEGKVIGRGIPGYILSEDFVVQDSTGFMRLNYNFGIGIGDLIFALFRTGRLIGQQVKVYGWYRRGPGPVLQLKYVETADGHVYKCHAQGFAYFMAILLIIIGLALWFFNPF
jgi:Zn-dependent protease with chaperone function